MARKVKSIIKFAAELIEKLNDDSPEKLVNRIQQKIDSVVTLSQKGPPRISLELARELEKQGTDLWNLCIRHRREAIKDTEDHLTTKARLLAFCILEVGRGAAKEERAAVGQEPNPGAEVVHLMALALTLARVCLESDDVESGKFALQKAAKYVKLSSEVDLEDHHWGPGQKGKLESEYLTMRMALAWKEKRFDVAEHMFSKTESMRASFDSVSAENLADLLHRIGAEFISKDDVASSVKWLKKAYQVIVSKPIGYLSPEGLEARQLISQDLLRTLLKDGSEESISEAGDIVSYAEAEMGDIPIVLHWNVQILQTSAGDVLDAESYAIFVQRMIGTFDFTEGAFDIILYHIRQLERGNNHIACRFLDELIRERILLSDNKEWLNKSTIQRVWMTTLDTRESGADPTPGLMDTLDFLAESLAEPLSQEVVGAIHLIIWTKIETELSKDQYTVADGLCSVALHRLFGASEESNRDKFGRKQMACALELNDAARAKETFERMSQTGQDSSLTRFLLFKTALTTWDCELGCKVIEYFSEIPDRERSQDMLYACINEARLVGNKLCLISALKVVVLRWDQELPCNPFMAVILRCCIRVTCMIDEDQRAEEPIPTERGSIAEDICTFFETAARWAKQNPRDADGNAIFTIHELDWFRKNAYNIGVVKCDLCDWKLRHIVRIFNNCIAFMGCYPKEAPVNEEGDIMPMFLRCHFVNAVALVSLARTEDKKDGKLQRYTAMRRHIRTFEVKMNSQLACLPEEVAEDFGRKMSFLTVFEFEGATALEDWDDLPRIVKKAESLGDIISLKAMGDCLLRSDPPEGRVIFDTLRLIINQIFKLEDFDSDRLARYLRCLFQAIIPLDDTLALKVVDEALEVCQQCKNVSRRFPAIELEWLAAATFNHAVDFYACGEDDACYKWGLKAIELAGHMDDGRRMAHILQDKFKKLCFVMMR